MQNRTRSISLLALLFIGLLGACAAPAAPTARTMTVYKSPTCGCCSAWISHLEQAGYTITVKDQANLSPVKAAQGVPPAMQSCHTALIDGYVIEGHVPVADIERLLRDRPAIRGIAVPGMPIGSPGMEVPGVAPEPFAVLSFDEQGNVQEFSRYNQ